MSQSPLIEIAERPREMASASLEAWQQHVLPSLTETEVLVYRWLCSYVATTRHTDATGGELAAFSGLPVTTIRPRLTGMSKKKLGATGVTLVETHAIRQSRVKELRCCPYSPTVPLAAIERMLEQKKAGR